MVCVNNQYRAAIQWDDIAIYGFVVEPTEYERCLVEAINSLPITCRQMVILFVCERLLRETIAQMLGMPIEELQVLIHDTGLDIRKYLAEHGHPWVPNKKLEKFFKGWPYSEYGDIVMLRQRMEFIESRELKDEYDCVM